MRIGFALPASALLVGALGCGNVREPMISLVSDGGLVAADTGWPVEPVVPEPPRDAGAMDAGMQAETQPPAQNDCPDLFTQDRLRRYELQISSSVWSQIQTEFLAGPPPADVQKPYYPVATFSYEGETRTDVSIRLKGDSSWRFTVMMDANPKAQFVIAFDKQGGADFHGVDKINFDMPQSDLTMMHERLSYAYERAAGVPAPCANNAELVINGKVYGLYVAKEQYGGHLMKRLFPGNSDGVLLKYGFQVEDNAAAYSSARVNALWKAYDVTAMLPLVDMEDSLRTWAAEALINDDDGYWGGNHNFYVYEYPGRGFRWLTDDADATFEWSGKMSHPLYWWVGRSYVPPYIPQHYLAVLGDDHWRAEFVEAIRDLWGKWDVSQIQSWIDAWGPQIADAVGRDPHRPFSTSDNKAALARARAEVAQRADYIKSFLNCTDSGSGDDKDSDGVPWCKDCNDGSASINGVKDPGCVPPAMQ